MVNWSVFAAAPKEKKFKNTAKRIGTVAIEERKHFLMGDFFFGKENFEWGFVYFTIRQNPLEHRYMSMTDEEKEKFTKMLKNVTKPDDIVIALSKGSSVRFKMETRTMRNQMTSWKDEVWTKIFFARPPETMSAELAKVVNPENPEEYENFGIEVDVKPNVLNDFRVIKAIVMVESL